ncbi:hypothetical protein FOA52_006359 [Chlamydomonas sp. UWO 241]|nr:hypothetical protein FOA52_006359 [Chlamydomonas sp. UWO 241]
MGLTLYPNAANGQTAVRLRWLREFAKTVDPAMTTADVVTQLVVPGTISEHCRYIEILDPKDVGPPDFFISHRWGSKFETICTALFEHLSEEKDDDTVCVWLDIFAINQHPGQEQADDLGDLQEVIKRAKATLLVMDGSGQVLRRVWCLFEIWKTVHYKTVEGLIVVARGVDLMGLKDIFLKLNVAEAQATVEADRLKILSDIKATTGIEAMNQFIRQALVESARKEVQRLAPLKATSNRYFAALDKAGQMMTLAGMYSEAEPILMECLQLCEERYGEAHAQTASVLNNIAGLLRYQGKLKEAEPHQKRALKISEDVSGDSPKTATYLGNLAQLLQAQGKLAAAEPLLVRALKIPKLSTGRDTLDTATVLNALASLYMEMNRPNDALPLYKRALSAVQMVLSPQDPELAVYLANLASVLQDTEEFDEAEDLQRQAVTLCERNLGHEHPMTASCLSNLAEMMGNRGLMADAEELARDALTIRVKVLGEEHPSTANSYNNVAGLLMEQERYDEAEPLMRKALVYTERSLGAWHPLTANRQHNLATLLDETGQDEEAIKMYSKAMTTRDKKLGPDHPDTLGSASSLAGVYLKTGRWLDSLQLYRRCVAAHRLHVKTGGGNAAREALLANMTELAMALHKTGHHDEALQNVEEAMKLATSLRGPESEEMTMFADMKESLQSHVKTAQVAAPRVGGRRSTSSLMPQRSYGRMASMAVKPNTAMQPVPPTGSGDSQRLMSFTSRRAL